MKKPVPEIPKNFTYDHKDWKPHPRPGRPSNRTPGSAAGGKATDPFAIAMAKRLRKLRRATGMNQSGAAEALGLDHTSVHYWERGVSMPRINLLPEIAKLYGVPIEALFLDGLT